MVEEEFDGLGYRGARVQGYQVSAHNLMYSPVERGKVAGIFGGAADVRAQGLEQIAVRDDTLEYSVIVDHEKMMKFKRVEDLLDDIKLIIHFDRHDARRHDVGYIHHTMLYDLALPSC